MLIVKKRLFFSASMSVDASDFNAQYITFQVFDYNFSNSSYMIAYNLLHSRWEFLEIFVLCLRLRFQVNTLFIINEVYYS